MADIRTWNKTIVAELITLYKSFPCLWKIKSEEYKNKYLKEEAYNELIDFCKEKGFLDANRDFVVKKIQSLRGSFRKELRKVTDSQCSGRGTDDVYKSSLWYFDNLLFTKDQEIPTRCIISNIDEDLEDESLTNDDETHVLSEDEQITCDVAPIVTATSSLRRRKRKATSNHREEIEDTLKANGQELSEFDIAGMNVAKKLTKMDPLQAIYAESVINNVLRKGLLKKLTEDTDLCDHHCNWRFLSRSRSTCELPVTNTLRFACEPSPQMFQSGENQDLKPFFYEGSNTMLTEDPLTED